MKGSYIRERCRKEEYTGIKRIDMDRARNRENLKRRQTPSKGYFKQRTLKFSKNKNVR